MVDPTITAGAEVSQDEHLLPADSQAQKRRALGMSETQIMIIWFLHVYLCVQVCLCQHVWGGLQRLAKDVRRSGAGATGRCGPPNVGAGN